MAPNEFRMEHDFLADREVSSAVNPLALFPSVNDHFLIPTYGSLIAALNFDLFGTINIGKRAQPLVHDAGLVATFVAVPVVLVLAKLML